jgi:3-oxoacyl-[acyl-carrier protein] reductase
MFENFRVLDGMRVLVVGGGGVGNGRAITAGVGAAGASVAVVDLDGERAEESAEDVKSAGGTALALVGDVRSSEDIDRFVAQAAEGLGGIDVLITVVGGYTLFTPWIHLDETSDEAWDLIIDVNLRYVFRCVRQVVRVFKQQASGGSIVSVGSISGSVSSPNSGAYGAAKAGLVNLAKTVSVEYARDGIRMNVVSCGVIATEAQESVYPGASSLRDRVPMGRPGRPEEIAAAVVFMASPLSSYVGGQNLTVDGALTARFPLLLPNTEPYAAS